jgi:uncharacterized protein (TIGR03435 family)
MVMKILAAVLFVGSLAAQPTPAPSFEAATIKPSIDVPGHSGSHSRTGMLQLQGQTLRGLIRVAYHLIDAQVAGGPKWMDSDRFDVNAKARGPAEDPELMLMLQSLLAERFKLTFHHEKKEYQGYVLVIAKGGLKIQPVEPGEASSNSSSNDKRASMDAGHIPMSKLADILSRSLRAPVEDATGATGVYSFKLEWTPDDQSARVPSRDGAALPVEEGPSIYTAIQTKLGLKLEPRKVPMDVLVIDSAEKPSEN